VQADGKLVAAGRTDNIMALARYRRDGALDPSFGNGGRVTTDLTSGSPERITALAQQADGKLVAAGEAVSGPDPRGTIFDFALTRYNPDGSLDPTFGSGGTVTTDFADDNDEAAAVVVQPDGKLVIAGSATTGIGQDPFPRTLIDFALARYNPDGSLDSTFGQGGKVTTNFIDGTDRAAALVLQPDGKLVAAGLAFIETTPDIHNERTGFGLARYNPDGSLDPTFGTGGTVISDTPDLLRATALVRQPDGKLVAAGTAVGPNRNAPLALVRYNPDGSPDPTFGTGGTVVNDFGGVFQWPTGLVRQPDGKLAVAGGTDAFLLARFNPNGTPDPKFGTGGLVTTSLGPAGGGPEALAMQADGKLVAAGWQGGVQPDFALVRYRA
jgi:uncharacterized delta-60 repeat protein